MKKNKEIEEAGEYNFFYICRKCDKSIEAHFPNNLSTVIMVEVKKHNYEFECEECHEV